MRLGGEDGYCFPLKATEVIWLKSRVICDRLDYWGQLITSSFNGIKQSVFAMCLFRAPSRTWPVICSEWWHAPEMTACLFRVEAIRGITFCSYPERLPFAMTASTTEWVEWYTSHPNIHIHPEPANVTLFGNGGLWGCNSLRISRWDHPGLSGWNLNPVANVLIRKR